MIDKKIAIISGTRPEAIKLAPVYLALRSMGAKVDYIQTGQHSKLHDQVTTFFNIKHSAQNCLLPNKQRDLGALCSELIKNLNKNFKKQKYTDVVVQGDTASALCGSHVAFLNKLNLFHVEAGLRTPNIKEPFPEEAFRRQISIYANINFCPTQKSCKNLLKEGVVTKKIYLTGNTIVDSLRLARKKRLNIKKIIKEIGKQTFYDIKKNPFILLTVHRRENHGKELDKICKAIKFYCSKNNTRILCPVHPNPDVKKKLKKQFRSIKNIHLVNPLSYQSIIWVLDKCKFIVSDSGGLQEEAPSFNKRILILRKHTERPEVIESGFGTLTGTNIRKLLRDLKKIDRLKIIKNKNIKNPFGNGYAADKISKTIMSF